MGFRKHPGLKIKEGTDATFEVKGRIVYFYQDTSLNEVFILVPEVENNDRPEPLFIHHFGLGQSINKNGKKIVNALSKLLQSGKLEGTRMLVKGFVIANAYNTIELEIDYNQCKILGDEK